MFTGLIETTGTLLAAKSGAGAMRLVVAAPQLAGRWKIGDSIAVNGVCLTALDLEDATEAHPGRFAADLAQETIERTSLCEPAAGSAAEPGAADTGGVAAGRARGAGACGRDREADLAGAAAAGDRWHRLAHDGARFRRSLAAQVIPQGSITIDGISLTVAKIHQAEPDGSVRD